MKKWLLWIGSLVLVLSLISNLYLYRQHIKQQNQTRHYVALAVKNAAGLLNSSATMQIAPNSLNNSTEVRGLQVGQAASELGSVAPLLDEMGVHHMPGIAVVLEGDSFPMMFPGQMQNAHPDQALGLVRYTSEQLDACLPNGKLDFKKLQTAINNIYQRMPAQERQNAYDDTTP